MIECVLVITWVRPPIRYLPGLSILSNPALPRAAGPSTDLSLVPGPAVAVGPVLVVVVRRLRSLTAALEVQRRRHQRERAGQHDAGHPRVARGDRLVQLP